MINPGEAKKTLTVISGFTDTGIGEINGHKPRLKKRLCIVTNEPIVEYFLGDDAILRSKAQAVFFTDATFSIKTKVELDNFAKLLSLAVLSTEALRKSFKK